MNQYDKDIAEGRYYVHRDHSKEVPAAVYPYEDPVAVLCNEDGKLNRLPVNRSMKQGDGRPLCCQRIASPRTEYRRGQAQGGQVVAHA